jgi:hypothetical protein
MRPNTGSRGSPHWRTLYEAAILELDCGQVLQRIAEAQRAIMDRMEDMNRSENGSESEALIKALNVLRDLRKMADAKGEFQE